MNEQKVFIRNGLKIEVTHVVPGDEEAYWSASCTKPHGLKICLYSCDNTEERAIQGILDQYNSKVKFRFKPPILRLRTLLEMGREQSNRLYDQQLLDALDAVADNLEILNRDTPESIQGNI